MNDVKKDNQSPVEKNASPEDEKRIPPTKAEVRDSATDLNHEVGVLRNEIKWVKILGGGSIPLLFLVISLVFGVAQADVREKMREIFDATALEELERNVARVKAILSDTEQFAEEKRSEMKTLTLSARKSKESIDKLRDGLEPVDVQISNARISAMEKENDGWFEDWTADHDDGRHYSQTYFKPIDKNLFEDGRTNVLVFATNLQQNLKANGGSQLVARFDRKFQADNHDFTGPAIVIWVLHPTKVTGFDYVTMRY